MISSQLIQVYETKLQDNRNQMNEALDLQKPRFVIREFTAREVLLKTIVSMLLESPTDQVCDMLEAWSGDSKAWMNVYLEFELARAKLVMRIPNATV